MSLVFPFGTALTPLQLETRVRRVASPWPPIPVTFRAVRRHANHLRPEFPYEPHLTIARQAEPQRLEHAHEEAREAFGGEFSAVLREVDPLAVAPDGKIEPLRTIPLDSR